MFCSKCGKEVSQGLKFCPHCGKSIGGDSDPVPQATSVRKKKYKCPNCGSVHVCVYDRMGASVGAATQMGKKSLIGVSKTSYNTMWQCADCGFKFWDLDEARSTWKSILNLTRVLVISVGTVISILPFLLEHELGISLFSAILFIGFYYLCKLYIKKQQSKLDELEKKAKT